MAKIGEMLDVINSVSETPVEYSTLIKSYLRLALCAAEDSGGCYNYEYMGQPCTFWVVGSYHVTYITDDKDLFADYLTEDMMDDLIIEEA